MKHSRLADIAAPLGLLWRRQSLSRRIMLTLLVAMLPFVLVILLTSANSRWAISDSFDSLLMDDTRKRSQIVSMELDAFNDMLFQLVSEDAVVDQLTVINQAQDAVMGNYYGNALYNMIKRYKYARTGLAQTAVIAATGTYVSYDTSVLQTTYADTLHSLYWDSFEDLTQTPYYIAFSQRYQEAGLMGPVYLDGSPGGRYVFFMGEQVCNLSNLNVEGVAIFAILEDHLDDMCNLHGNEALSFSFLIDRDGAVLTHRNDALIGQQLSALPGLETLRPQAWSSLDQGDIYTAYLEMDGARQLFTLAPVAGTGYLLASCFGYEALDQKLDGLNRTLALTLTAMALLVLAVIFQFSRSITRDVSALAEQILNGSWEDQGGQEEGGYTGNELEIIVSSYHLLLRKFQSAMDSVRQSAQREKRLELSALESQINSHFLYNTLDSINWMAIEGENYEISEMISRLALILRYSISASARVVPFSKELSWLEGHLYIQRRRFNGSFSYDLSIGHETIDFPVRKLILQPFIENAVLHGVRALDRPGLIALSACLQDGGTRLRILIEDNGQGMTPQAVQLYFYHPEQAKAQGHVGIANVLERLKHYYGENYQLTVWSQPGAGTRVTLVLPRADGEE